MTEFAALLLVSTLFGGMMLYWFGFAPILFSALPTEDVGLVIRAIFSAYYLLVIVTAGLGGAILLLSNSRSGAVSIALAVVAVYSRQVVMPQINDAREMLSQGDADAKKRFGHLHGISAALSTNGSGLAVDATPADIRRRCVFRSLFTIIYRT
jgi:hypothetical protein